jgi:hypothetical protein
LNFTYAYPPACEFEIIVVDNASKDGAIETLRSLFPQVILVKNSVNKGFAGGNNCALSRSSGRYLLLLNPDSFVHLGTFDNLISFMDDRPEVGICGAVALNPDGSYQAGGNKFPTLTSEIRSLVGLKADERFDVHETEPVETDWVGGACLMVRRRVFDQIGLLDERFFMYCEETDLCWRAKRVGWRVYLVPRASYVHLGGQSTQQARFEMLRSLYLSKAKLLAKHRGSVQGAIFAFLAQLVFLIKKFKWDRKRRSGAYSH